MRVFKGFMLVALSVVTACTYNDRTVDRGIDAKDLSALKAGIWIDPNGCDHWIIDDGLEGYLSARLDKNGKPVCSGTAQTGIATGEFRSGSNVVDFF